MIDPALRPARADDWPAIAALLTAAALPLAGAHEHLRDFVVATNATTGVLLGCAGVERYDGAALLRSAAVAPAARSQGLGDRLVREVLRHAAATGCHQAVLLTTTADRYFPRFGFRQTARGEIPLPVQASVEFASACPVSAVVMRCELAGRDA